MSVRKWALLFERLDRVMVEVGGLAWCTRECAWGWCEMRVCVCECGVCVHSCHNAIERVLLSHIRLNNAALSGEQLPVGECIILSLEPTLVGVHVPFDRAHPPSIVPSTAIARPEYDTHPMVDVLLGLRHQIS